MTYWVQKRDAVGERDPCRVQGFKSFLSSNDAALGFEEEGSNTITLFHKESNTDQSSGDNA